MGGAEDGTSVGMRPIVSEGRVRFRRGSGWRLFVGVGVEGIMLVEDCGGFVMCPMYGFCRTRKRSPWGFPAETDHVAFDDVLDMSANDEHHYYSA